MTKTNVTPQKASYNPFHALHLTWAGCNRNSICFHYEKIISRAPQRIIARKSTFCWANEAEYFFPVRKAKYANERKTFLLFAPFCSVLLLFFSWKSREKKRFKNNFIKNIHVCQCQCLWTSSLKKHLTNLLIACFTQLYCFACLVKLIVKEANEMREVDYWERKYISLFHLICIFLKKTPSKKE